MEKFKVKTGGLNVTVEASNHRMAAIKAIKNNNPGSIGLLISVLKEGEDTHQEVLMKSEFILDCMGIELIKNG